MGMSRCGQCGADFEESVPFCGNCGARMDLDHHVAYPPADEATRQRVPSPEPSPEPLPEPTMVFEPAPGVEPAPAFTPPPPPVGPPSAVQPPPPGGGFPRGESAPLPAITTTVLITFFFGLFGLIPASSHAARARALGDSGRRYWKAFWLTMLTNVVIAAITIGVIIAVVVNAADDAINEFASDLDDYASTPYVESEDTYVPEDDYTDDEYYPEDDATSVVKAFSGVTFTYDQTTETGDTSTVSLELGSASRYSDAPDVRNGTGADVWSYCDIDEERDLVIPFHLQMTNTNDALSQQVSTSLYFRYPDEDYLSDDASLGRIAFFGDGADCEQDGDSEMIDVHSTDPLGPGESSSTGGYLILSNAVSPTHPDGDPAMLGSFLAPLDRDPGETDYEGNSYVLGGGPWQAGLIRIGAGG